MRVERRGDVVEVVISDTPVRHVMETCEAIELADMIYEQFGIGGVFGDLNERCPLTGEVCWGRDCAWWVEGHGLPGRCAVAQMAREPVRAPYFDNGPLAQILGGWDGRDYAGDYSESNYETD